MQVTYSLLSNYQATSFLHEVQILLHSLQVLLEACQLQWFLVSFSVRFGAFDKCAIYIPSIVPYVPGMSETKKSAYFC